MNEEIKNEAINYAIWLNENTRGFFGSIVLDTTDKIYYTDTESDMNELFDIYLSSDYYKNTHENSI